MGDVARVLSGKQPAYPVRWGDAAGQAYRMTCRGGPQEKETQITDTMIQG